MKIFYPSFFAAFIVSSCATRVDYIGRTYAPTQKVAVYVEKAAVNQPYDIIGKGYAQVGSPFSSLEKIQKKAVLKGKKKGAHAVIIEDYFVLDNDRNISSTLRTDSTKNAISVGNAQTHPAVGSGFQILFIRFK